MGASELGADDVIRLLGLAPLPGEGGHFLQTWRAGEEVVAEALPARYGRAKRLGTAIYYLLSDAPDSFSALHRLPTDEVYHFYLGDPVELLLLAPGGGSEVICLGSDLRGGQRVQAVVPRGVWQGSRLLAGGRWALMGTTMAPGWDPPDLELGAAEALAGEWPERRALIRELARD
jgi:predicted cupin superfamily sugar epimerase